MPHDSPMTRLLECGNTSRPTHSHTQSLQFALKTQKATTQLTRKTELDRYNLSLTVNCVLKL